MKFNFKKIASVLASVVMLGSTIGIAAAANYPAPFISGGAHNVAVVYGAGAASSDIAEAGLLSTNLQLELNKQATGTSGTGTTATGGDSVSLSSSSQKLYMNSALNSARGILTKDHLPTLLADGTATDNSGTEYKYTQTVTLMGVDKNVTFSKSGESMDPALLVVTGYTGSTPFYNYTLTFAKTLNVSDSSVIGNAVVKMQGQDFTIGANSDYNTLYLYGSGVSTTVDEGQTKTVSVGDVDHTINLVGVSGTTTATVEVDGVRKSVTKGTSYKFAGDFQVYIKDLTYLSKTGSVSSGEFLLGSKTLHFENAQTVKTGADDTTILGTYATVKGTNGQGIDSLTIGQGKESATGDYLKVGQQFTDRVFGGIQVEFSAAIPDVNSSARESIKIDTDNSIASRVTFTSYLAGTAGEKTIAFARDRDLIANSAYLNELANDANKTIYNIEGSNAVVGDWIIANSNDEGRIFQVISIGAGTSANDYTRLRDIITNVDYDFSTGTSNATSSPRAIGGAEYYAKTETRATTDSSLWTVNLTWGAGSSAGAVGTQTTLYPRIKTKNGAWISFLTAQGLTNGTTYSMPGLYSLTDYQAGKTGDLASINATANNTVASWAFGNVNYTMANATYYLTGVDTDNDGTVNCNFNVTNGPAVLIQEEKTLADSNGNAVCVPLTIYTSGSNVMPGVGTPVFTDGFGAASGGALSTNTYKTQYMDIFGTLVERDVSTGTNYAVTVTYPDDQMYADVLFKSPSAVVTPGSAGTSGSNNVIDMGNVLVKDTEVSLVSSKNLIVVGGSCINSVAAKILANDAPACGADFTAATGVGASQALVKVVTSPYSASKIAMVVAGYEATDTVRAATWVRTSKPATDVNTTKKLSTTDTVATVIQ